MATSNEQVGERAQEFPMVGVMPGFKTMHRVRAAIVGEPGKPTTLCGIGGPTASAWPIGEAPDEWWQNCPLCVAALNRADAAENGEPTTEGGQ